MKLTVERVQGEPNAIAIWLQEPSGAFMAAVLRGPAVSDFYNGANAMRQGGLDKFTLAGS